MATSRRPRKGECITIQNLTDRRQSIFDTEGILGTPGKRFDIEAYQTMDVEADLAGLFLTHRPNAVQEYVPAQIPDKPNDPKVWIANGTGNPFLPDTVKVSRIVKGERVDIEIPNPVKRPQIVMRTMHGGFEKVGNSGNEETRPKQSLRFEFPPYRRFYVSRTYAEWNIERDTVAEAHHQGKIRVCAAPRPFEPNNSWPLEHLQVYARLLGIGDVGKRPDIIGKDESEYANEDEVNEARDVLARALFFTLLDDIGTPNELDFKNALRAHHEALEAQRKAKEKEAKRVTPPPVPTKATAQEQPAHATTGASM